MTQEVLFAGVPVTDLAAAIAWYERVFGRSADIVPNDTEVMWCVTSGGWIYVIQDSERAGRALVTVSVSDLDGFVENLSARGVTTEPIQAVGEAGRKAISIDPDGNVISWIEVASAI